jgi:hypothetical protein
LFFNFISKMKMETSSVGTMKGLEFKNFYIPTIPYWWYTIASQLPGKAYAVGSQIWFCYRTVSRGKFPVKLSRQFFSLTKLDRKTVRKALSNLEKAGLITVERCHSRAPLITITLEQRNCAELHRAWLEREYH